MKNISRPQYYRIRRILEMIREGTTSGSLPNARTFCDELGVSRPTVMRDMDWLRDEENAPIAYDPALHGYAMTDATWEMPPVSLTRREVFAFSVGSKLLAAFKGTPLEMDMEAAFGKIAESLEGRITLRPDALTDQFSVVAEDYVQQDPETWTRVAGHIERREAMKVTYEKFNGDVKDYVLEPYHLFAYHGNWYVSAATAGHDEPATFAVSRIQSLEGKGTRFEVPDSFDAQGHIERAFGIVGGQKSLRVRLLFSRGVAAYIKERVWHPSQQMRLKKDGAVELVLTTTGRMELTRWILSWQPDCKVLAPESLRKHIQDKLRRGVKENDRQS